MNHRAWFFILTLMLGLAAGRSGADQDEVIVAPGVGVRSSFEGGERVRVIEVDLRRGARLFVGAQEIALRSGRIMGRARTLPDWLAATGAVAGVNGGFFGQTNGADYDHKEILGILKLNGRVRSTHARPTGKDGQQFARAAFGITEAGEPMIGWVAGKPGSMQRLVTYPQAAGSASGAPWAVREAIGCGPRLIAAGREVVTARAERLISPGLLPRTFVGIGRERGKPAHVVLAAASAMEFTDCARFLIRYFRSRWGIPCADALCLDGGSSTAAAWRDRGRILAGPDPSTRVPTALLVRAPGDRR